MAGCTAEAGDDAAYRRTDKKKRRRDQHCARAYRSPSRGIDQSVRQYLRLIRNLFDQISDQRCRMEASLRLFHCIG